MASDDRDPQFERALARRLRHVSSESACPDAETLAAYQAGALSLQEMAQWKKHIAECERCQEILLLVAQTEDVPAEDWQHAEIPAIVGQAAPAAAFASRANIDEVREPVSARSRSVAVAGQVRTLRSGPRWRWLVPIGAIAASVIVWIGTREMRTQRVEGGNELQIAQNRAAAPPAASSDAVSRLRNEAAVERKGAPGTRQNAPASASTSKSTVPPAAVPSAAVAPSPPPAGKEVLRKKDSAPSAANEKFDKEAPPFAAGYVEKGRSADAPAPMPRSAPVQVASDSTAQDRLAAAKPESPSAAQREAGAQPSPAALAASSEISAEVVANKARDSLDLVRLASGDPRYVVAPGEGHAWRLGAAGRIERSTDGGKSWKLQDSGVTADLTAGSATSDKVCWVIGKSGTVLLTNDGGTRWKRLASPISGDMGGIHATDSLHATIWDVPHRQSYQTTDGGATWIRSANE
jgi:Photosynthesis system II assembly factor YCF48